jgi:hypothetical protein
MDVNGAKALKERLGPNRAVEPLPASVDVEVPEDAPPVYHWFGVGRATPDARSPVPEDACGLSAPRSSGGWALAFDKSC